MKSISNRGLGFTLVELLLVLAVIGIISAIAIPSLTGQRDRAKKIGDAQANAKVLSMMLESRKAENGVYGIPATHSPANWTPDADAKAALLLPQFSPSGNSKMVFMLVLDTPLTYTLEVREGTTTGTLIYKTNQAGATL